MAENTKIEWAHHTHNVVWGCQRVSPSCENCYAETLAKRYGHDVWGPPSTTPRRTLSESYWRQPLKWNAIAEKSGERARVFCSSMADVFEEHRTVEQERQKLWQLIEQTPWLDWLLLTKRPENIMAMTPDHWAWGDLGFPRNVWIGTTVESQEYADKRIPELLKVPAVVRFLSMEPLLGPVRLQLVDICKGYATGACDVPHKERPISWVITGGESGPHARPGHPDWYRSLRDQCQAAGVPFHFKQWGEWAPCDSPKDWTHRVYGDGRVTERKEPADPLDDWQGIKRVGKHNAGRELDGRTWDEFPESAAAVAA